MHPTRQNIVQVREIAELLRYYEVFCVCFLKHFEKMEKKQYRPVLWILFFFPSGLRAHGLGLRLHA